MEAKKLDNLFRKHLRNLPAEPSEDAWAKMEAILDEKPKAIIGWRHMVAASLVLLVSAILYWTLSGDLREDSNTIAYIQSKQVVGKIKNHFSLPASLSRVKIRSLPQLGRETEEKEVSRPLAVVQEEMIEKTIDTKEVHLKEDIQTFKVTHIASSTKKKKQPIRITYKRGGTNSINKTLEKDSLRLTPISELQPDQLWADLRDAKNRAIKNALKLNRNKDKTH